MKLAALTLAALAFLPGDAYDKAKAKVLAKTDMHDHPTGLCQR